MKISAGSCKGRNLKVPQGIRPLTSRVRQSVFDMLQDEVVDKSVLDLFAGSGALGIEALSRGAKNAVFVDELGSCVSAIQYNIHALGLEPAACVYRNDVFSALRTLAGRKSLFDLVFIDPPYYKGLLTKALQTLEEYDIVAPFGLIVGFCYHKDDYLRQSSHFEVRVEKTYGQTLVIVYGKK